jgi:hypothetical protein
MAVRPANSWGLSTAVSLHIRFLPAGVLESEQVPPTNGLPLGAPLVRNQGQHGSLTPRKDLAEAESLIEKTLVEVAALEQTFPGARPGSHAYHSPTAGKAQEPGKPPTINHLYLLRCSAGPARRKGST